MPEQSKSRIDPSIIAALIGVLGTVIVAIISLFGPRLLEESTPSFTSTAFVITSTPANTDTPVPTDTVPAGEPTSTPAPTDTLTPTNTPAPELTATSAPIPIGQDWGHGCISALWQPYSSTGPVTASEQDGCLSEPVDVFFANSGQLSFLYESRLSSAEVHGLFAPIPVSSSSVSITVSVRDLNTSSILIGVFSNSTVDSQGLLMTLPPGDESQLPFVVWRMPGLDKIAETSRLSQGSGYGVRFELSAGSVRAVVLPNVFATNTYPVSSNQMWLFVGYQALNGTNRVDASFFDLIIE